MKHRIKDDWESIEGWSLWVLWILILLIVLAVGACFFFIEYSMWRGIVGAE